MAEPATAVDIARRLADALEKADLPYAIGGALALAYYAVPRATVDVDINIFVPPATELPLVLHTLQGAGFAPDASAPTIERQATTDGQFRGYVDGLRVDVFVPAINYYAELQQRRRQVPLAGRPAWVLGPEDIAILKLMFYRRKDLADVESLLREQGGALNLKFVADKLRDLVGDDDERLRTLTEIADEVEKS
ncbi:MAG: hypothetical protein P8R42_13725 [Candidatus Binatia bacterium]|nr:hypothetical protein [Candidatus Binatia bacterium]